MHVGPHALHCPAARPCPCPALQQQHRLSQQQEAPPVQGPAHLGDVVARGGAGTAGTAGSVAAGAAAVQTAAGAAAAWAAVGAGAGAAPPVQGPAHLPLYAQTGPLLPHAPHSAPRQQPPHQPLQQTGSTQHEQEACPCLPASEGRLDPPRSSSTSSGGSSSLCFLLRLGLGSSSSSSNFHSVCRHSSECGPSTCIHSSSGSSRSSTGAESSGSSSGASSCGTSLASGTSI
eukprot:CAMPEP_0173228180 /NCGR_PEP_ID=MMETSP1142-20121109/6377_1 /TAXON_ID=483371 /ORGANISM="non described non described, Strain CCMP2298" /LENGTH=230 /DNA_ID=CAMNT_0014156781 /DNA_START=72 /DNA_END=761 /DNA_ORIENTATION=+